MPVSSFSRRAGGGGGEGGGFTVATKGGDSPMDTTTLTSPATTSSSKYELEDYVYEMECRAEEIAAANEEEEADVYTRLAQKERDLILAAELGKALLERNEILVQQNERLAEEYSHKLEVRQRNWQEGAGAGETRPQEEACVCGERV
uniref:Uncharacterized protein n=1 Tax=Scylla olivacea TaxID=85551 RepID=A0A0P4WB62_SCYOL